MSKPGANSLLLPELPVGLKPAWELEDDGSQEGREEKRSISDSCVVLQSLRRSRERWLYLTFPRFSTKTRAGKGADLAPPPHTIQTRGKCDLEIGPHVFPDTVFYEVHYLLPNTSSASTPAYRIQNANAGGSLWQSATPYNGSYTPRTKDYVPTPQTHMQQVSSTSTARPVSDRPNSSAPLMSSLDAVTTITPALINQVNAAASSNPTLANLLQLAAAGKASPDQLKTLGLLIQSLATPENTHILPPVLTEPQTQAHIPTSGPALVPPTYAPHALREFDLVFEFNESSSERWVFPRGLATCERIIDTPSVDATCHTIIKARLPFDAPSAPADPSGTPRESVGTGDVRAQETSSHVVKFHLKKTPLAVWDTISRWVGDERRIQENRQLLEVIDIPDRNYLAHHLEPGFLLSQLQMASLNAHLKPLKPGPQTLPRAKRKAATMPQNEEVVESPTIPHPIGPKRRRAPKVPKKSTTVTPILCLSCGQADVPLIFGGRFCRPCVDNGKVIPSYNYASYVPSVANMSAQALSPKPVYIPREQTSGSIDSSLTIPTVSNNELHVSPPTESPLK